MSPFNREIPKEGALPTLRLTNLTYDDLNKCAFDQSAMLQNSLHRNFCSNFIFRQMCTRRKTERSKICIFFSVCKKKIKKCRWHVDFKVYKIWPTSCFVNLKRSPYFFFASFLNRELISESPDGAARIFS